VLLRASRPRQWSKNLLVLAAPGAAGLLDHPGVAARVAGAFLVMCMVSSATYLVNDVRDRDQDRLHPTKRHRPIAAGELSPRAALIAAALLAVGGLGIGAAIAPRLGLVALGYLVLTASYSLLWRSVVVADMLAIAGGFVLRPLAGSAATNIHLSRWFMIVTACGAVFLVAAKRYAELRDTAAGPMRATLRRYSPRLLGGTLLAAGSIAAVAYVSWALTRSGHLALYALTIAPFLLWLGRYAELVSDGAGEAPEELILHDRALLALSVAWTVLFLAAVYAGH
jgi:decaprenyl-phosphate phosphoribosyltransferase